MQKLSGEHYPRTVCKFNSFMSNIKPEFVAQAVAVPTTSCS